VALPLPATATTSQPPAPKAATANVVPLTQRAGGHA